MTVDKRANKPIVPVVDDCFNCESANKAGWEKPCLYCNGASRFSKAHNNPPTVSSHNNGGKTDYYDFDDDWKQCQDVIEGRNMNFSQGNIFKACFCFNTERHKGTSYERELNKIIFFAQKELGRIKK